MSQASVPFEIAPNQIESDLKKFLFKEDLSESQVIQLASLASYKTILPNELILAEGATNENLYILIEGSIEVIHRGEKIATLSNPGEILGEMSLITKRACSASNYASTQCLLLVLQPSQVKRLPTELQLAFTNALNQVFLRILADRLTETNRKARLFEIANRDLIGANWALEAASVNRIDEMSSNQQKLVGAIQSIVKNKLPAVRQLSLQLGNELKSHKTSWQNLRPEIESILTEFEGISKIFDRETPLYTTNVLFLEQDVGEQINTKMSLVGTGVHFKVIGELEEAKKEIAENHYDLICLTQPFVELGKTARLKNPKTKLVFVTSQPIGEYFETLRNYPEYSNIIARHPKDRAFTAKNIAATIRKLANQDLFGVEKYLNWGTQLTRATVTSSTQRHELVNQLEEFIQSIGIRSSLRGKAIRVAEELLMNVIYDAPTTSSGHPKYNHQSRTQEIQLEQSEYAQFNFGCDGSFLAISAVDPFGALTKSTVLNYLERCLSGQSLATSEEGKGGGGNGLYQMVQSSSLTVFNVWPKKKTEVIALFNINTQIEKISLHPSFQFFELEESK